ncbi:aminopeptidase [uncultured Ilyobacter sp.]|uniref:aminopeptidase n=1 Tax=uncultured Ilyobacter sp. TaxID=544433 RepID=UPI0029F48BCC|nr:aminopeptidase [uncultured Ilyobacter sp.]
MLYKKENGWKKIEKSDKEIIFSFSEKYKEFLNIGKTEREFVRESIKLAESHGFKDVSSVENLKAGDKIYYINREKNIVLVIIGKKDIVEGINFIVSHIDCPRLDLKQNPLYEDTDLALMKTHYYGGIKKYQWGSTPLALHGAVVLKSGEKMDIIIGEDENDPVFSIPDILPHLDSKVQRDRSSSEVLKGEELHIVVGSIPSKINNEEVKEFVKYAVLEKLNEAYGMEEEDFLSAELQLVPAHKSRDVGFDRGIVGSYGHDDRICAFTSIMAILDYEGIPEKTAVCFMADKEEIGSTGSTGLQSFYIEYFVSDMIYKIKGQEYSDYLLRKCFWNSRALSSDVNAGINPIFKSVHDPQNAAMLGYGIVVSKYTGARGKSGTNDADAEYVGEIRTLFNENNIKWQMAMLGKVDEGGGGTVAMYLAHHGIKTIDAGPAVISMHSPFELASKFDIYETYKAYKLFYK